MRLAGPVLDDLCEHIGETVALAMWGNRGATCVRWLEAGGPVTVTLRTGVVLSLTSSATGLAFAAFYRSPYLKTVSYTHLDVYKRQGVATVDASRRDDRVNRLADRNAQRPQRTVILRRLNGDIQPTEINDHQGSCLLYTSRCV